MNPDRTMIEQLRAAPELDHATLRHGPRSIHAHVTRPVVQQLVKAQAHTVLDLGCGDGWFTGALDRCGFDVMGVDVSEAGLRLGRHHHPHLRLQQVDAMNTLPESLQGRFDAVVAIDVIDHVPRPRRIVEAALSALKPGGLLAVTSTFHGYSKNIALALTGRFDARWDPLREHGQMKFFSRSTLISLLSEFDLHDMHFETVGRIPIFARSMLISGKTRASSAA